MPILVFDMQSEGVFMKVISEKEVGATVVEED